MKPQHGSELTAADYYLKSGRLAKWGSGIWLAATLFTGTDAYAHYARESYDIEQAQQYSADGNQQQADELSADAANNEEGRNVFLALTALDLSVAAMSAISVVALTNARRHSE